MRRNHNQSGFGHILLVLAVLALAIVGLAGWRVFSSKPGTKTHASQAAGQSQPQQAKPQSQINWMQTDSGWTYNGTPPACPDPVNSPVNLLKVTSILYPGQIRGDGYESNGGFRFDNNTDNSITITAPFDANLYNGVRYKANTGDIQYAFDFIAPCGYYYHLGHLLTLSPKLQAIANKLPLNGVGDSRSTFINTQDEFKGGEVLATATGMTKDGSGPSGINVFVDWGLYDLRAKNKASQNTAWAAQHPEMLQQYGVCWIDKLSSSDQTLVKSLPAGDAAHGKTSDYCL